MLSLQGAPQRLFPVQFAGRPSSSPDLTNQMQQPLTYPLPQLSSITYSPVPDISHSPQFSDYIFTKFSWRRISPWR